MRQLSKRTWFSRTVLLAGVVFVAACAPPGDSRATKPTTSKPAAPTKPAIATKPVAATVTATPKPAAAPVPRPRAGASTITTANPNVFNRLLKKRSNRHPPPWQDAIHNPDDPVIHLLQAPMVAFAGLPKTRSGAGNGVAWVKALEEGKIKPRWVLNNPKAKPAVLDLNIVREVKGSMPDVVYPHKAHTEWLDCSNCHPAIFIPQKGANQISMAAILMGKKCGVCHGTVAFPVSACLRCHSKPKPRAAKAKAQP